MPTIAARNALTTMWPLIFASLSRALTADELSDLRRACDVLLRGIPGHDSYNDKAEQLCLAIQSSGIFENKLQRDGEKLLESIDELKQLLR